MQTNTLDAHPEQDALEQTAALEAPAGLAALLERAKTTGDNLAAMQAARLWVGYCSRRYPGRETAPVALAALQEVIEPRQCPLCHGAGETRVNRHVSGCLRCHGSGREFGGHEHDGPLMNELLRLLSHLERTAAEDGRANRRARYDSVVRSAASDAYSERHLSQPCMDAVGAA